MVCRSEKIRFRWTGIFAGLAVLAWVLARGCSWFMRREMGQLYEQYTRTGSLDSESLHRTMDFWREWVIGFVVAMLGFLVSFLICFVAWLLAIKKRRKALEAHFPTR